MMLFNDPDQVVRAHHALQQSCGSIRSARLSGMQGVYLAKRCNLNVKGKKRRSGCDSPAWEEVRSSKGELLGWRCVRCKNAWDAEFRQCKPGLIDEGSRGRASAEDRLSDLSTLGTILAKCTRLEQLVLRLMLVGDLGKYAVQADGTRRHRYEAVALYVSARRAKKITKHDVHDLLTSARAKIVAALKKQRPPMWSA